MHYNTPYVIPTYPRYKQSNQYQQYQLGGLLGSLFSGQSNQAMAGIAPGEDLMSGAATKANPFMGAAKSGISAIGSIANLFDKGNKYNKGTAKGEAIGSVVDVGLNFIPGVGSALSGLGLGKKLGSLIGSKYNQNPPSSYNASSNTTGNIYRFGGLPLDYSRVNYYDNIARYQMGSAVMNNTTPNSNIIEIEDDEGIFNPSGLDLKNGFKLLNNSAIENQSPFFAVAKGNKHNNSSDRSSSGIKADASNGYIASSYLGVNGKRATKKNPSVSKVMLKQGGSALARGFKNSHDKFGVNNWNPGAVNHHLRLMENVRAEAEANKARIGIN